ncbi:MAG TPA: carbon storage regulator [Gemmataceae bacterium]|jgi:carbon storage regulator|nr:carbon storage regulator [Gemmataceae bacterium]
MLVLSRKPGEKLCIDGNIVVTVLEVKGNRVRIGIEAPDGVRVLRGELYEDWQVESGAQPWESELAADRLSRKRQTT